MELVYLTLNYFRRPYIVKNIVVCDIYDFGAYKTPKSAIGKNHQSWGLRNIEYLPNETSDNKMEDIDVISAKSCLTTSYNKNCADARGAR